MPMSPRLLRPRQTGFDPRSISGLALWLDAADSQTLYTTDAGPVTAVSSPLDIAGCELWFDASDTASITESGGLVSQWNDKSGKGRHATSSGSARPTTGTRTVGGRNALDFNGTSNSMTTSGSAFPTAATHTVFIVYQLDTAAQSRNSVLLTASTITDQEVRVVGYGLSSVEYIFNGNAGTLMTTSLLGLGPIVFSAREATKAMRSSGAGVLSSSIGNATAWSSGSMLIGGRPSSNWLDGLICEIAIYNSTLSDTDTARVEAYLAAKWGISGVHAPATATNDPVGAWLDRSGRNTHVVTATAANRPLVGSENSRRAIAFDGTNDNLNATPPSIVGSAAVTHIAVVKNNLTSQPTFLSAAWALNSGNAGRPIERWQSALQNRIYSSDSIPTEIVSPFRSLSDRFIHVMDGQKDGVASNQHRLREFINGAQIFSVTSASVAWSTTGQKFNIGTRDDNGVQYKGNICEVLCYDKILTTAERQRIERYLAAKWGITLAPQVSNADAQDWVNRVYQNGGTVSASTASAVNTFCNAIDSAGIRDRFYRLNLFAGNSDANLAAVRTPLFRGPSLTGTQYGNATDTNVNFVQGDYAETGASSGLKGNGTTKSLNTGVNANALIASDSHMGFGLRETQTGAAAFRTLGGAFSSPNTFEMSVRRNDTNRNCFFTRATTATDHAGEVVQSASLAVGDVLMAYPAFYRNGVQSGVTATTSENFPSAHSIFVFALNGPSFGGAISQTDARMNWYSIGLSMTAAQALSFYNATAAFNSSLSRT